MSVKGLVAIGGAWVACCGYASAQMTPDVSAREAAGRASRPVVVEFFVSQACNQSPPAAELLQHIADRPDIVALTWHVDYWDDFPAPGVGPWKDPFARPDFGARQMTYNSRIRGRAMKMTPQAVIDGAVSVAGAKREAVERRILEARFLDEMARPTPPTLMITRGDDNSLRTRINNVGAPYDALVVNFRKEAATNITGGDNAGVVFREVNIVSGVTPLASDQSGPGEFSFSAPANGLSCAVIVQERGGGRIVAARYCSDAATNDK